MALEFTYTGTIIFTLLYTHLLTNKAISDYLCPLVAEGTKIKHLNHTFDSSTRLFLVIFPLKYNVHVWF
jgi:hypothetical protein